MISRLVLVILGCGFFAAESAAQVAVELSYGVDRNVDSGQAERDGWINGTIEWMFPSGLGIGMGTDHQFDGAGINPAHHLGWAMYVSTSYEYPIRRVAPFVRGGVGLGRAPCQGDTCSGGAHVRGSAGLRIRVGKRLRFSGELGISRVSRPFGGAGVSYRF